MNLRSLALLHLVCCGGGLLLLIVPSTVFAAAAATLVDWVWPLVGASLGVGALLWRYRRRAPGRDRSDRGRTEPKATTRNRWVT